MSEIEFCIREMEFWRDYAMRLEQAILTHRHEAQQDWSGKPDERLWHQIPCQRQRELEAA